MNKEIFRLISHYDSIVIIRHKHPDYDAYGAQFGLAFALKRHFPKKRIIPAGDDNDLNQFGALEIMDPDVLKRSLLIILDTSVKQMLEDEFYLVADKVVILDHHQNSSDIPNALFYQNTMASSTAEMVVRFLMDNDIPIDKEAARALFMGIVGDTGRFLFSNVKPDTFRIVATLLETGLDLPSIYQSMYQESFAQKLAKAEYLVATKRTRNNVGFGQITPDFLNRHQLDPYSASRMFANQLSGTREIPIWGNFTEAIEDGVILCELRSREIPIVEVAKKYGGGGHLLACGCRVASWEMVDQILADLDDLLEGIHG
jgi:phosphoesterase RecJ-like protein